jgi:hypothetical protein
MPSSADLQGNIEMLPTYDEIEKRAYDLYLKSGEELSATEYWLIAEKELKEELATADAKPPKGRTVATGAGRVL